MKLNYSEPKIYTGGVDIKLWNKLSNKEKTLALTRDWYVYFSFRNHETGRLERQTNIKHGANKYKSKDERLKYLEFIKEILVSLLRKGFDPYNMKMAVRLMEFQLFLKKYSSIILIMF